MTYPTQPPDPGQPQQHYPNPQQYQPQPGQPYPPPAPFGQPTPQPAKKGMPTPVVAILAVAGVVVLLCVLGAVMNAVGGGDEEGGGSAAAPSPAEPGAVCAGDCDGSDEQEQSPEPEPEPEPEPDIVDGIWTVGVDVDPGTYRTIDVAGEYCYWAILTSGSNGEDIQANFLGGGRPVVVIEEGQDFESSECGGWERVNLQRLMDNADPASTVEDGIWTVGLDIRAGTYRPTEPASDDCYWAVLEGRTNGNNIINNGLGGGRPTVTVERGQQFEVSRCGTWRRQ